MNKFEFQSPFLMKGFAFEGGRLSIAIEGGAEAIEFDYVRSFFFFKESDLWQELQGYQLEPLIPVKGERTLGVFRVDKGQLTERIFQGRLTEEKPQYFWVSTPDECVEVVAFEQPVIARSPR